MNAKERTPQRTPKPRPPYGTLTFLGISSHHEDSDRGRQRRFPAPAGSPSPQVGLRSRGGLRRTGGVEHPSGGKRSSAGHSGLGDAGLDRRSRGVQTSTEPGSYGNQLRLHSDVDGQESARG